MTEPTINLLTHFKVPPPDITKENPFANDVLERRESVESLATFMAQVGSPFVFAINSQCRTLKTAFVLMLRAHLEGISFSCLYLDLCKMDFATDPILSFLGQHDALSRKGAVFQKAMSALKKIGSVLAKRAIPTTGKLL